MSISTINSSPYYLIQNVENAPSLSSTGTSDLVSNTHTNSVTNSNGTFLQSVLQSLQGILATDTGTSSIPTSTNGTPTDPIQAMQTFLHDLFKTLTQGSTQSTASDSDGDNDASTANVSNVQNAYNNPTANLQNLISSLDTNNSGQPNTLQTDYANLIQSLGGSSSTTTSLQDFLKQLANNVGGSNALQSNLGNLFSAVA